MKYKVVLANGCFDIWHYGHLRHLQAARAMGDVLIVSVTDDAHVNKGPGRPIFRDWQRAEVVEQQKCVLRAIVVPSLLEALKLVQPDILCKGIDYAAGLNPEHTEYCKTHGIEIRFTDTPKISVIGLINESQRR